MPSWLSLLLMQGVGLAILVALFVLSAVESHVRDLVWVRLGGSIYAAVTRRSRVEQQQAAATAARDERIRNAMASLRASLTTFAAYGGVAKSSESVASMTADVHRGVAELRSEEQRLEDELKVVTGKVTANRYGFSPDEAQTLLAALEAKLRELTKEAAP